MIFLNEGYVYVCLWEKDLTICQIFTVLLLFSVRLVISFLYRLFFYTEYEVLLCVQKIHFYSKPCMNLNIYVGILTNTFCSGKVL